MVVGRTGETAPISARLNDLDDPGTPDGCAEQGLRTSSWAVTRDFEADYRKT